MMNFKSLFNAQRKYEYFRVRERPTNRTSFTVYSELRPAEEQHAYAWMLGKPIPVCVQEPVVFERDRADETLDILLTNASQVLVSTRAKQLVMSSSNCARSYSAEVRENGRLISSDYWAINFECSVSCMDLDRSTYKRTRDGIDILAVHRLVLKRDKIPGNQSLFRLSDYLSYLICSGAFVQQVESEGLTGFDFEPVDVHE